MTGKRIAGFIAVLGFGLGLATSSSALPITWAFEGQVTLVESDSPDALAALSSLGVSPGAFFAGQLVFESTSPDQDPDPAFGYYTAAAISFFEVTVGSFHEEVTGDENSTMYVYPRSELLGYQGGVDAWTYGPSSYSTYAATGLHFHVIELTPGEIASDALPLFPPGLGADENPAFWVEAPMNDEAAIFQGTLTRLVRVPEPGLGALVALSLAALGALRSRAS